MKTGMLIGVCAIITGVFSALSGEFNPVYAIIFFGILLLIYSFLLEEPKHEKRQKSKPIE